MIFHLPLRKTEGSLRSIVRRLAVNLPISHQTTLSRRLTKLGDIQFRGLPKDGPIHLLLDSTGLRIHVGHVTEDGAYDTKAVYEAAHDHGGGRSVRVLIPPGRNARLSPKPATGLKKWNHNIRPIRKRGRHLPGGDEIRSSDTLRLRHNPFPYRWTRTGGES